METFYSRKVTSCKEYLSQFNLKANFLSTNEVQIVGEVHEIILLRKDLNLFEVKHIVLYTSDPRIGKVIVDLDHLIDKLKLKW